MEKKYKLFSGSHPLCGPGADLERAVSSYTPVGATHISGVQARYYYPLLLPLMLILGNKRCIIDIRQDVYGRLAVGIPALLMMAGIFLKNDCN